MEVHLHTYVGVRLMLITCELLSFVDRSVKCPALKRIIERCVPQNLLESFTLFGTKGNEAVARMTFTLDLDEHKRQVEVSGDAVPDELRAALTEPGPEAAVEPGQARGRHCAHTSKAVDLFANFVQQRGLRLRWSCAFRERAAQLCQEFDLTRSSIVDLTRGAPTDTIINSQFTEIICEAAINRDPAPQPRPASASRPAQGGRRQS